jgi:hypothetical protein
MQSGPDGRLALIRRYYQTVGPVTMARAPTCRAL